MGGAQGAPTAQHIKLAPTGLPLECTNYSQLSSFDIAKGGADSEAVDRARIMLGVATANSMKSSYQKAVTGGLDALLEWKNGRKGL